MKKLLILLFVVQALACSVSAQTSAQLAADLQSANPAHWPAINALLIAQRDELTAANLLILKSAADAKAAEIAQLRADLTAAREVQQKAAADHTALKSRIATVLNGMLNEELKTGDGPKAQLLRQLIAESEKSDDELKREALEAEIAAKQAELEALTK